MTKRQKLINKIKSGIRVSPTDIIKILKEMGLSAKGTDGSHQTWSDGEGNRVTIILTDKETKSYIIDDLQKIIKRKGL